MERVVYKNNPLVEVIIQIRFPKILSINVEEPIAFQEAIRADFPMYQLAIENQHEISVQVNQDSAIPSILQKQQTKNHNFISADGMYKINLTNSFISISTVNYTRWEEFISKFSLPLKKFQEIYAPPFCERVGLRYIDAFSKTRLNITQASWSELINQRWIGAYGVVDDESKVISSGVDVEYILNDDISRAKIHSGLGMINNDNEKVFILDSDFIYAKNLPLNDCETVLEQLHVYAKEFISNAISTKLHEAMGPEKI